MNLPHLTEIGKIQKTHGVNGELQVSWLNDFYPEDHKLESVFLLIDGMPIPFFIQSIRSKGGESSLLKLEEVSTIDQATELLGHKVFAEVQQKVADDELFLDDLVGYTIITHQGVQLGTIDALQDYSGNLVFEIVSSAGNEILIPATPDFILDIDEETKTITMELPEGLADL